ncbi:hypothetical protein AYI70_g958 [Smittium culicis]|uniref:Uncharacterized protein n=1 Tax=Smittium culicis TaxID=133412 RepID=A0A1R1YEK8_9FUNG|nr:hypothetical protein AYI70_g958 [Smittium culicis]
MLMVQSFSSLSYLNYLVSYFGVLTFLEILIVFIWVFSLIGKRIKNKYEGNFVSIAPDSTLKKSRMNFQTQPGVPFDQTVSPSSVADNSNVNIHPMQPTHRLSTADNFGSLPYSSFNQPNGIKKPVYLNTEQPNQPINLNPLAKSSFPDPHAYYQSTQRSNQFHQPGYESNNFNSIPLSNQNRDSDRADPSILKNQNHQQSQQYPLPDPDHFIASNDDQNNRQNISNRPILNENENPYNHNSLSSNQARVQFQQNHTHSMRYPNQVPADHNNIPHFNPQPPFNRSPIPSPPQSMVRLNTIDQSLIDQHQIISSNDPRLHNDPRVQKYPVMQNDPRMQNNSRMETDPRLQNDPRMETDPRLQNDPRMQNDPRLHYNPRLQNFSPPIQQHDADDYNDAEPSPIIKLQEYDPQKNNRVNGPRSSNFQNN